MQIKVVDAGCGVGKTTAMINYINEDKGQKKYLYITPLLTEVERIQNACSSKKFIAPQMKKNKSEDLIRLVENGENIISTHALFKKLTDQILDLTKFEGYTLIMDEVADVIEEIEITKNDLKTIVKEYTNVEEDGTLHWWASEYEGRFEDYKKMIETGGVAVHMSDSGEVISLVWIFPIKIFESFKEVYILTYLFNGQKSYYDYNNIDVKQLYVKDFHFTEEPQKYNYEKQKKLISVCEAEKLNEIGDVRGSLSLSWFKRNRNSALEEKLKKNIYNFFRHKSKTLGENNIWTTFKEYEESLKGKGYSKCFVSINARATNEYRKRTAVAYIANRYMKPTLKHFFESNGIGVDEDTYALSELVQFVYRSAIRDNKPIIVYIPSKRMRELFTDWINKKDE